MPKTPTRSMTGGGTQIAVAIAVLFGLAAIPPARGAMLVVPLAGSQAEAATIAIDAGAAIVGPGPLPGSLIVAGDRRALWPIARHRHALLTAASAAGCGGQPAW